jgi:outer membrane lipoprotein-sorting protein
MPARSRPSASFAALFLSAASTILIAACAQTQKTGTETNANDTVVSSTPPFQTQEPERYRATRTTTIVSAAGQTLVTKSSLARDGELRRDETETAGHRVIYLSLPDGRFVLLPEDKTFAAVTNEDLSSVEQDSETSPDRLLHTETISTAYEKLGAESIDGRNLQKYRIVVNNSAGKNVSVGETFLWFDEALHMPLKTESSSPDGTRTTTELSNVILEVDRRLFEVPKDYQKIDFNKVRERLSHSQP